MREAALVTGQVAYLFLPLLGIAACAGVTMRQDLLPGLTRPIDGYRTFRGRRIFGDNKTWRGAASALASALLAVAVQKYIVGDRIGGYALIHYGEASVLGLGAAYAAGAVLGELPNSFLKRQLGVAPGSPPSGWVGALFYVYDQVDLVPTTWALLLFWVRPTAAQIVSSLALVFVVHQLVSVVGFYTGARVRIR
jgi:hypothetical protein